MTVPSDEPLGDSNPLLNPMNIPRHPRDSRGARQFVSRRQFTVASRLHDEVENAGVVIVEDNPPQPQRKSRTRMEIAIDRQVVNLVDSDSESDDDFNPAPPANAFSRSILPNRELSEVNSKRKGKSIVIISDSDDDFCFQKPKEGKRRRFDSSEQPGPSKCSR